MPLITHTEVSQKDACLFDVLGTVGNFFNDFPNERWGLQPFTGKGSGSASGACVRAMVENARQGFWNGSIPPFGYRTVDAQKRGQKIKKVLAVDDTEAGTVQRIFDLAEGQDGVPGPEHIDGRTGRYDPGASG
jgi:hypothetical protein